MEQKQSEMERIEKIGRQIELPECPKFGTPIKWVLLVISALLAVWGATRTGVRLTADQAKWNLVFSIPFVVLFLIVLCDILFTYIAQKREYEFSKADEQGYRLAKAIRFLKGNEKNKEYSELLHDFYKEYPEMRKRYEQKQKAFLYFLPRW